MSAAHRETSLETKLAALQCHFTWDLQTNDNELARIRDGLLDIGTDERNQWLGHIYNLLGYIHFLLKCPDDARKYFTRAAEAFCHTRGADEGPWLLVNYANVAWLHYHNGDEAKSQEWLSKANALLEEYQSSSQNNLHAEIYAEKGWALLKYRSKIERSLASDYLQKASEMQPDMVEWYVSFVSASLNYPETCPDMLEKMKNAKRQDPENLFLAAQYLMVRARNGEQVLDKVRKLATKIMRNPVSSYSGLKTILTIYQIYDSVDEAIALAEEALRNHPGVRYLKRCAALCYKWKVISPNSHPMSNQEIKRAIDLHKDVISLYPDSSFVKKMDLATIYTKSAHCSDKAGEIFQELLESRLEPPEKQVLFNIYAKHVFFHLKDRNKSLHYHIKAVEIPEESLFRRHSIRELHKAMNRDNNHPMRGEIEECLNKLQIHFDPLDPEELSGSV
ncbi:interferon-induced protein with tetratricopeptide repeats 1-like [Solea senegalensis]|uniref:Interferon-induced protein with tetratricopeptide repeats 1-like n=1 Tax=Solea senegalensis TaxID=28829 RepID=A0AAV6SE56_SOLSE|nr:interferon-induced protein with tetratricopeptide repeats 1-like [Solea senegalensis]KAG7514917.1 interferon-induced protein with tetratricopeptide repeats 1-like [Solea senegalensis]